MQSMVTLTCPSCGARVNIPEDTRRFTCEYCGNQHVLQFNIEAAAPPASEQPIRPRVPAPQAVQVERDEQGVLLTRRWFSAKYIPLAFFALIWDGFLIFWYTMVTGMGAPLIFALFPMLHLGVGVYLTYSVLAGFLNRTVVELNQEELSVWHDPLPWPGEIKIKINELKQLYCKEQVRHGKNGPRYSYHLYAVTHEDREVKLLSGLDSPDIARYFEQQLESMLHIADRPVVGELGK